MHHRVSEADWKRFRRLRESALEQFCARTLSEAAELSARDEPSAHENYLKLFRLIQERDKEIVMAFDSPSRSQMYRQLGAFRGLGLLGDEEFEKFTEETRRAAENFATQAF